MEIGKVGNAEIDFIVIGERISVEETLERIANYLVLWRE